MLVQIRLPEALLHSNENFKPCPRFSFSADGWGVLLHKKAHIFIAFAYFQLLYLNHLQLFYDEGYIPAHLEVKCALHIGRAQEEYLSQERKSEICQRCKPYRKRRKGTGYSQKDTKTKRREPDRFSQQLGSSACSSVILSLITGQIGPGACAGLCTLLIFEGSDRQ